MKKQATFLPLLDRKNVSNITISRLLPVERVPHPIGLESGTAKFTFGFSSPLTTKGCDQYMLRFAPNIDLFICL